MAAYAKVPLTNERSAAKLSMYHVTWVLFRHCAGPHHWLAGGDAAGPGGLPPPWGPNGASPRPRVVAGP
eukprot:1778657-Heterocapsa_arctica.AAC.1